MEGSKTGRIFNFNAGPAVLPLPVLEKIRSEILCYGKTGMSVMEMSHRDKVFDGILHNTENNLRKILGIPDDYAVLFLQGGARLQFAMIPMNLYSEGKPVDVLHTGEWSKQAITELKRLAQYRLAASTESEKFMRLPRPQEIQFSPDASYVHLVANNTICGTQWHSFPDTGSVPLIADMTSDILSRPLDVRRFGMIFASAQKNLGIAGVTAVIIRKDLAQRASEKLPTMLLYRSHIEHNSCLNTAPTFAIYVMGLVLEWVLHEGGLGVIEARNREKAKILYDVIDASPGFYQCPIHKPDRSLMNVVFRIRDGNEELEKKFAEETKTAGLAGLKGHRSVGGLRASIYNAQSLEGVKALRDFMKDFEKRFG